MFDVTFGESDDYEYHLDMHFNDRFSDECRTKECGERNEEVAARDAGQIEQWIGYLWKGSEGQWSAKQWSVDQACVQYRRSE